MAKLIKIQEVAEQLGMSCSYIRRLFYNKKIKAYHIGEGKCRSIRFTQEQVDEYLKTQTEGVYEKK